MFGDKDFLNQILAEIDEAEQKASRQAPQPAAQPAPAPEPAAQPAAPATQSADETEEEKKRKIAQAQAIAEMLRGGKGKGNSVSQRSPLRPPVLNKAPEERLSKRTRKCKEKLINLINDKIMPYLEERRMEHPESYGAMFENISIQLEMVNENVLARQLGRPEPYPELDHTKPGYAESRRIYAERKAERRRQQAVKMAREQAERRAELRERICKLDDRREARIAEEAEKANGNASQATSNETANTARQ